MPNRYDHRLRNAIVETGNVNLFPELSIPPSTARDWIRKGQANVITASEFECTQTELAAKVRKLQEELACVKAKSELLQGTTSIFGFSVQYMRLKTAAAKESLLKLIDSTAEKIPLDDCLHFIGLSVSRFKAWKVRVRKCELSNKNGCTKLSPTRMLSAEIQKIKDYVLNPDFRHFSISSLSILAKRNGDVSVSPASWYRVIKEHGLKMFRKRLYPPKNKTGIRADKPHQYWRLDLTVIKLVDGTRCFVQAVIDNFSRYVLSYSVAKQYTGLQTKELLTNALENAKYLGLSSVPKVYVDGGSENSNKDVQGLVNLGKIVKTVCQIEVDFSNSMIEAFFHRLKNKHLYYVNLTSFEILEKEVKFYILEANEKIPLSVLGGLTPLEAIQGDDKDTFKATLLEKQNKARKHRLEHNKSISCHICPV